MTEKDFYEKIGLKIRELRKKSGLTQQQLAAKVGLTQPDLSALENRGEKIRSAEKINEILSCLGYELDITERKNYVDLRVEKQELDTLHALMQQMNDAQSESERLSIWEHLKQKWQTLINTPDAMLHEKQEHGGQEK